MVKFFQISFRKKFGFNVKKWTLDIQRENEYHNAKCISAVIFDFQPFGNDEAI